MIKLIPKEIILDIANRIHISVFLSLSCTSSYFSTICSDEAYWRQKCNQDMHLDKIKNQTYKSFYMTKKFNTCFIKDKTYKSFYLNNKIYICGELEYEYNINSLIKVPSYNNQQIFDSVLNTYYDEEEEKLNTTSLNYKYVLIIDIKNNISRLSMNLFNKLSIYVTYHCRFFARLSVQLIVGDSCAAIIDQEQNLYTFGQNYYGLGLDSNEWNIDEPTPVIINNVQLKVLYVSFGAGFIVILDVNNNVWRCGSNNDEQLGIPQNESPYGSVKGLRKLEDIKIKQIAAGRTHILLIDLNDNVWTCGRGGYGQLGLGSYGYQKRFARIPNIKAKLVSGGYKHSALIDMEDNVLMFGSNEYGQLGVHNCEYKIIPTKIGFRAKSVSCGIEHTALLDMNNNVWTFGNNKAGQLGIGNYEDQNIPMQIPDIKARSISAYVRSTIIF